jgi:hypothetical protein
MVYETNWYDYDEGFSIGTSGADGGIIIRDEEHRFGARMTIEEEGSFAPFSISCGIYGWMVHTRFFSTETEADEEFDRMKVVLEKILSLIPEDGEADEETMDAISDEIAEFVEMFP